MVYLFLALVLGTPAMGAQLAPKTKTAYERYVNQEAERLSKRINGSLPFLWVEENASRRKQVQSGNPVVEERKEGEEYDVPSGLIQHWIGAVFIPGATVRQTLDFIQNYDNHKNIYGPEVVDSKLLAKNGDQYRIYLRLLKQKVITVVLNTEHEVHFFDDGQGRWHSRSTTTKVTEVESPGQPDEHEKAIGEGYGFLWRMDAFWRFAERDGGTYVECESITLSRSIPMGLSWMLSPIVKSLPEQAMVDTMRLTRAGVLRNAKGR